MSPVPTDPSAPKDPKDPNNHDTLDSQGTRAASWLQDFIDALSVCSPPTERSRTPSLASESEAVLAPRTAQESGATHSETLKSTNQITSKVSAPTPAAEDRTFEQPAEPTVVEPMEETVSTSSEQSNTASLASAAGSGGVTVVEDGEVGALITALAGLSLDDLAPPSSDEATVNLMESTTASIGDPVEPSHIAPRSAPASPASRQQWVREWAQQVPSTGYIHPITGQLVGGPSASVELAGESASNSGSPNRQDGVRDYYLRKRQREVQVMSPLQEDQESQSSPGPGSGVPSVVVSLGSPGNRPSTACRQKLTDKPGTRKRARSESSDEENNTPQTPAANKRRNLGVPGSTPYRPASRPRALTANITPYSERRRRRAVEKDGRIHSTAIRVSQLLAQQEADRRRQAAESSAPLSPFPGLPQTDFEFTVDKAHNLSQSQEQEHNLPGQPSTLQQPVTPERTRGWNIRGLLNSVPRRFSRIIPSFGRSPERTQESVPFQPSSERVNRTQTPESYSDVSQNQAQPNRGSSEEPPQKRARRSWSLFPQPFDRSLYLADLPKKESTTPSSTLVSRPVDKPSTEESKTQESIASDGQAAARTREHVQDSEAEQSKEKKRKRSPSPDVIPNPPGCSYGLDLDYFCYSSESDEEQELPQPRTEQKKPDHSAKAAVRSALRSERPSSKKVRFDASPENTPSKLRLRARATDPYHGRHFIGMGNDSDAAAPDSPTPASHVSDESPTRSGFVPNRQGTFQLDYDAFSDDSESSGSPSAANVPAPSSVPSSPNVAHAGVPESVQSPDVRLTPRQTAAAPSTPAKIDEEALARARSQAEKYKPKTPSGLRTASRYSSPLTATPDTVSASVPVATPTPASADEPVPEPEQPPTEDFGDDEFAREAQWLFENCPSGDLSDLVWPQPVTYEEQGFSPEAVNLVNEMWDPAMVDYAYANIWTPGLEAFKRDLELGVSEATQA